MSYQHPTQKERYFIYHMNMAGWSPATIDPVDLRILVAGG